MLHAVPLFHVQAMLYLPKMYTLKKETNKSIKIHVKVDGEEQIKTHHVTRIRTNIIIFCYLNRMEGVFRICLPFLVGQTSIMSSRFKDLSKYALGNGLSEDFGCSQGESFAGFHRSGIVSQNEFVKSDVSIIITDTTATAATTIIHYLLKIDLPFLFFLFFFFAFVVVF
jgi:hypothetical protein